MSHGNFKYSLQQLKSSFGGTFGSKGKVKMLQKLGKFLFRVNFNGFLLGLDKLALFKACSPGTYCKLCWHVCIDTLTLLSNSSSDIF